MTNPVDRPITTQDRGSAPDSDENLAELIASRLCHDLNNPLGAIGNGVELLEMTGGAGGAELSLISDAVRNAQARVRFMRLAFGAAQAKHVTPPREARAALAELYHQSKIAPEWEVTLDLPRNEVRLGCLMMLCAETALPMGGSVTIGCARPGAWELTASGPRVVVEDDLWSVLRFGSGAAERMIRAAEVQFPALYRAAADMGLTVNYRADENGLVMSTS